MRFPAFIVAVALAGAVSAPAAQGSRRAPAPPVARPLAPAGAVRGPVLQPTLDPIVRQPGWQGDRWSVLAVSLDRGDTLYAHTPDRALAPASNMKIFTTAAAFVYLGPDYRYQTFLVTDGRIENGVLVGNLYLYGTGDPTLGRRFQLRPTPVLEAFADTLMALGVREIRGDIVGDGSYFQGPGAGQGWQPGYLNTWYSAPAGALSIHENLVRLEVAPGEGPGWRPAVKFIPGGQGISIVNLATTGGGGGIMVRRVDYDGPIVVQGRASGKSSHAITVLDPARYAAAVFRDLLRERGVAVPGGVRAITEADESPLTGRRSFAPAFESGAHIQVLAVHTSAPLREILHVINQQSHNFYAEQVLRTVGRVAAGEGSPEGGARAVLALLASAGVDTATVRIYDGCGLSILNRASARTFVSLLAYMARSPMAAEFQATLPVAGKVRRFRRMGGTPAEGNLRAKTGTIDHVSALSGYVTARNGERIAFSILSNNVPSTAQAKYIENRIGATLAAFARPAAPSPAGSGVPAPAAPPPQVAEPARR